MSIDKNVEMQMHSPKDQEMILVVKREDLLKKDAFQGIKEVCFDTYLTTIMTHQEFVPRGIAEQDERYKQIIPYLVFTYDDRYFLMQRSDTASEARLQNKYSLGIGGHIRQEDIQGASLFDWARREFYEEVHYAGAVTVEPLGMINDDSDAVGRVHAGFVFLVTGTHGTISVKSELKKGMLVPLEECMQYNKYLENWSKLVLTFLLDKKYDTEPRPCCCHK